MHIHIIIVKQCVLRNHVPIHECQQVRRETVFCSQCTSDLWITA